MNLMSGLKINKSYDNLFKFIIPLKPKEQYRNRLKNSDIGDEFIFIEIKADYQNRYFFYKIKLYAIEYNYLYLCEFICKNI